MVDYDFVAAIGTKGGLNCAGDGEAGIDVADNGAVFGIVAVMLVRSTCGRG